MNNFNSARATELRLFLEELCCELCWLQHVVDEGVEPAQIGVIGDTINMAARLMATAGPSQIVVSNTMHQHLSYDRQKTFEGLEPLEARNMGRIRAWRLEALAHPLAPSAAPE